MQQFQYHELLPKIEKRCQFEGCTNTFIPRRGTHPKYCAIHRNHHKTVLGPPLICLWDHSAKKDEKTGYSRFCSIECKDAWALAYSKLVRSNLPNKNQLIQSLWEKGKDYQLEG